MESPEKIMDQEKVKENKVTNKKRMGDMLS